MEELTSDFLKHEYRPNDIMAEINNLISLMKKGEIDPDQFLADLREDRIPNYEHLSTLQYFEAIREGLEDNKKKLYGT